MKIALGVSKACPVCGSERTTIRAMVGLEWLMVRITGLRQYRCVDCGREFRAADRRRVKRNRLNTRVVKRS